MSPEAIALHFVDNLDSKLNQLRGAARNQGSEIQYVKGLQRYVYLPGSAKEVAPEETAEIPEGEPIQQEIQ
jgi:hypothetical protein